MYLISLIALVIACVISQHLRRQKRREASLLSEQGYASSYRPTHKDSYSSKEANAFYGSQSTQTQKDKNPAQKLKQETKSTQHHLSTDKDTWS
jgi:hypothetical protein